MPGLDRTGPEGKGSQTGKKKGRCNSGLRDDDKTSDFSSGQQLGRRLRRHLKQSQGSENEPGKQKGFGRGKRREGGV